MPWSFCRILRLILVAQILHLPKQLNHIGLSIHLKFPALILQVLQQTQRPAPMMVCPLILADVINSNSNGKNSTEFESPACNTRSRKKPCVLVDWQPKLNVRGGLSPLDASTPENLKKPTSRKSSKTFSTHKMQALNPELVNAQLEILKTSMQCCALACFTWMTLGMVMGWRLEYVDLESHKRRREWLERKFDEMDNSLPSSSTISFDYALSVRGYEKKKVCVKAFDFAYGIPTATHKRCSQRYSQRKRGGNLKPKTSAKKLAKVERKCHTPRASYFAMWLKQYALTFGDQLPFGDKKSLEIRLPQAKKKMVWESYKKFATMDQTFIERPLDYEEAVTTWSQRKDLSHIKCAKYKPGFSKCDRCAAYENDCSKQWTEFEKKELDAEFAAHIAEERYEREQYYSARVKSTSFPLKYLSIILDAMDQNKTNLPRYLNPPKALGNQVGRNTLETNSVLCTDQSSYESPREKGKN